MHVSTAGQVGGGEMIDITHPEQEVEVLYRNGVLWVNIDGVCRLRCCQITNKVSMKIDVAHHPHDDDSSILPREGNEE